jgi:paraquat-inducible protein B
MSPYDKQFNDVKKFLKKNLREACKEVESSISTSFLPKDGILLQATKLFTLEEYARVEIVVNVVKQLAIEYTIKHFITRKMLLNKLVNLQTMIKEMTENIICPEEDGYGVAADEILDILNPIIEEEKSCVN